MTGWLGVGGGNPFAQDLIAAQVPAHRKHPQCSRRHTSVNASRHPSYHMYYATLVAADCCTHEHAGSLQRPAQTSACRSCAKPPLTSNHDSGTSDSWCRMCSSVFTTCSTAPSTSVSPTATMSASCMYAACMYAACMLPYVPMPHLITDAVPLPCPAAHGSCDWLAGVERCKSASPACSPTATAAGGLLGGRATAGGPAAGQHKLQTVHNCVG